MINLRLFFNTKEQVKRKLDKLEHEKKFWQKQAIASYEQLEYWQGTSRYYRDKWHEAVGSHPDKRKRLELIGEDKSYIDHLCGNADVAVLHTQETKEENKEGNC